MDLEQLRNWFASEEGKQSVEKLIDELKLEESEAIKAEENSKLTYPDGQKVKRGDLFIDTEAKRRCESDPSSEVFGYYNYVYRINEDETVDLCIDGNFALKLNSTPFNFDNAELIERDANLYSPLEEII
ncbi:hypothetical protein [Cytobacillus gottheilii]|uniref:hypothetical protein n=1 Tax=Cytobacillus gottheilii TaxID=859144 RepID=UPI0009BAD2EB|nr:hypothetical protein [Cytobacillus gottheilii]